eukprot:jgi/Chlat1/6506/Chrsp45S05991
MASASVISQFFILSPRGDTIISRDYRGDIPRSSSEVFFRKVKFWHADTGEEAPPVFIVDGVHYLHVKLSNLLLAATTRANVSPSLILELLNRMAGVIKDYCGVLSEDAIRNNFVLVYELLDEIIDFGYPQTTSTEALKAYVFNEPVPAEPPPKLPAAAAGIFNQLKNRAPVTAVTKSVIANEPSGKKREEIFVDVIERLSITFNSSGYIMTSEVDGMIQMKSYLSDNPEVRIALNDDLVVGKSSRGPAWSSAGGVVALDDCNFHESVRLDSFETERIIALYPPDGEFAVMNYRITQEVKPPFRIYPHITEAGDFKFDVVITLQADFPSAHAAAGVIVRIPMPKTTTRVSCDTGGASGQRTEFKEATKVVEWEFKKAQGGSEHSLRIKATSSQQNTANVKKEIGPISMNFSIPMYSVSNLQVRYLQIMKRSKNYNPYRWVRYVTMTSSYVCRL